MDYSPTGRLEGKTPVAGSERAALDRPPIGDVPGNESIDVMITLRPNIEKDAVDRVIRRLEDQGLVVENIYEQTNTLHVRGSASAMQAAFSVKLERFFGESGDQFRARSGAIYVPEDIAPDVTAVLGLDNRRIARPWLAFSPRAGGRTPLTPLQVAKAYRFPRSDGDGQTAGIIELGGQFVQSDLDAYLSSLNLPSSTVQVVLVMGAKMTPTGPNGADGEVMLDVEIVAATAPAASIRVYFGPNTTAGFLGAINQAIVDGVGAISISWGGPEAQWTPQAMKAYDQTFAAALSAGCSVFAASGDNGSSDGMRHGLHVDFPASSPHVTGCGGTRLTLDPAGALASEVVWNDNPTSSATGGGFSTVFPKPAYQAAVPGNMRGVPDVAGNGDPVTGYPVRVDGQNFVIGGTSAVAPLMTGLTLRLNALSPSTVGDFNTIAYANPSDFSDVTQGNNGAFSASPGWDPTTGLGSPVGEDLVSDLTPARISTPSSPPSQSSPTESASPGGREQELWDAIKSFRTAIDQVWNALQSWAEKRNLG
jgi:kumamolisin